MVSWEVVFARQAIKDAKKLVASGLEPRTLELLAVLANDPFQKALFALSVVTPWHESGKTEGSKGFLISNNRQPGSCSEPGGG